MRYIESVVFSSATDSKTMSLREKSEKCQKQIKTPRNCHLATGGAPLRCYYDLHTMETRHIRSLLATPVPKRHIFGNFWSSLMSLCQLPTQTVEILLYMGMSTVPVVHTVYTSYGQVEQSIELMNSSTLRSSYTPSWRERIKIRSYFILYKVK